MTIYTKNSVLWSESSSAICKPCLSAPTTTFVQYSFTKAPAHATHFPKAGFTWTTRAALNVEFFSCKFLLSRYTGDVIHFCRFLSRDGEEWLKYRKILNPLLLLNFNGKHRRAIEAACFKLITVIENNVAGNPSAAGRHQDSKNERAFEFIELQELEQRLYRWSIDGEKKIEK